MEYEIKYVRTQKFSYYLINNIECKFTTKSNKEVLVYIKEMEHLLQNKFLLNSSDGLKSDTFRAIEYFSNAYPQLVRDYFKNIKLKVREILVQSSLKSTVTKQRIFKYIANIPLSNQDFDSSFKQYLTYFKNNFKITNDILEEVLDIKSNIEKGYTINIEFDTPQGKLICLGTKYWSKTLTWKLNGFEKEIFSLEPKTDVNDLGNLIAEKLFLIHNVMTGVTNIELIDFTDIQEVRILDLYSMSNENTVKNYLTEFLNNLKGKGIFIIHGRSENGGITKTNVLQFISTNKDVAKITYCLQLENRKSYFLKLYTDASRKQMIKQVEPFINKNQFDISQDKWVYYYIKDKKLRTHAIDFSRLKNVPAKREYKLYMKHLMEVDAKTKNTLRVDKSLDHKIGGYRLVEGILGYLIDYHSIMYTADITGSIVNSLIDDLLYNGIQGWSNIYVKNKHITASTYSKYIYAFRDFYRWIIKNANMIKTKKPSTNHFNNISIDKRMLDELSKDTEVIPNYVLEQFQKSMHFLKPEIYQRMLLIYLNTPRRFDEIRTLAQDGISPLLIDDKPTYDSDGKQLFKMIFIEHKKLRNKTIAEQGLDYSTVTKILPVNSIVARELKKQIKDTEALQDKINKNKSEDDKIKIHEAFVIENDSVKDGYSLIDSKKFLYTIRKFIKENNIRDVDGTLWSFIIKQTRKTSTRKLIDNGINLDGLQDQLGHTSGNMTYNEYVTISKIALADTNTEYYKNEFDKRLQNSSNESFSESETKALFYKFCLDYRKIYYNRKLLGICNREPGNRCPFQETIAYTKPQDEFPCADCPSLMTGKSCKAGWECIKNQQELDIRVFEEFFQKYNIDQKKANKFQEYKTAKIKYIKASKVIEAIDNSELQEVPLCPMYNY
jgi:integrase